MVQIRNQQVLNRKGGWIVTCQTRQAANQRCHQMVSGHWAGLVPLRRSLAEQVEDPDGMVRRLRLGAIGEQLASLPSAST